VDSLLGGFASKLSGVHLTGSNPVLVTAAYSDISQYLKDEIKDVLQNRRNIRLELDNRTGGADTIIKGQDPDSQKTLLLDEVTRIEREWEDWKSPPPIVSEEAEQLRAKIGEAEKQIARLQNQATSPEVSKQKRRCFHLADDLRGLYRELQGGERALIAHLQEQKEANVPEQELEEEQHTKQLELEKEVRRKYHYGFSDRLEKLYEELEPDGWLGPNDERLFLNLQDPHDIMKVADRLDEVGRNLL